MKIMIVDDEDAVRQSLRRSLAFNSFEVVEAVDGQVALDLMPEEHPDLIILDVMMPRVDGFEVCRSLRSQGYDVPILMLTAKDGVSERVAGLDAGADDYLPKPFALEELLARVRSLIRRVSQEFSGSGSNGEVELVFEDLVMNVQTRQVSRAGEEINLMRTEFELLETFIRQPTVILSREELLEAVWGAQVGTSGNALEVYIGYLRKKTEANGQSRIIHTVRGVGYVLRTAGS